jgi:hypothetical protein
LNNNNDPSDGIFKDPSLCSGDTFYLWDEPDTQGRDYSWAGTTWLKYSKTFSQQLKNMRSRGTKVTGPLLKAGNSGVIKQHMQKFFDACGQACFDKANPAYIDVIAINGFCGPWNGAAGCSGGASFIYNEAVSVSNAFNNLPVYITVSNAKKACIMMLYFVHSLTQRINFLNFFHFSRTGLAYKPQPQRIRSMP